MSKKSFLFVPGNRPERFDKAINSGADAIIVDLEDAVAPGDKAFAREKVRQWLTPNRAIYLRINGAETEWFSEDVTLLKMPGVIGVVVPKAESASMIQTVVAHCVPETRIIPIVETALGLWHVEEIARAPQVERLAFGSVDFQLDCSIHGETDELLFARSQLVIVSRVAGILAPVDGVTVDLNDETMLDEDTARGRRLGFGGKLCVHPKQVASINKGFRPFAAEISWAEQVVEAVRNAGENAIRLEGKLIDRPVVERARAILASADA